MKPPVKSFAARSSLILLISLGLGSCSPAAQAPVSRAAGFTDKVWRISKPAGRAPGSIYIFLTDGTLLMTSCVETYRLATWKAGADGRLVVTEDPTVSYPVDVLEVGEHALRLRLNLVHEKVELELEELNAPFVCPDMPR